MILTKGVAFGALQHVRFRLLNSEIGNDHGDYYE